MVGPKAVDYFSIATCEVSEAGSSLIVKGKRSGSAKHNRVLTQFPKLRNAFRSKERRCVLT